MKMYNLKTISITSFIILFALQYISFKKIDVAVASIENNDEIFLPVLSGYKFFKGNLANLSPAKGTELYELTSHLFVDYAEKQRLIRLPPGTKMIFKGNGLPDFPDGTILVKTFYYYKNKRHPSHGKKIIETRLIMKKKSQWKVATYQWNVLQTEANLISTGTDENVSWIDANDKKKSALFHIPSNDECSVCHKSNGADIPIGLKLRNMNFNVLRNGNTINQIRYFQKIGWLDSVNIGTVTSLPNWEDTQYSIDKRARTYLEMNCAHCHNAKGSASDSGLFLEGELSIDSTKILLKKEEILNRMQSVDKDTRMPNLGTSIIDVEGLELIKQYVKGIN